MRRFLLEEGLKESYIKLMHKEVDAIYLKLFSNIPEVIVTSVRFLNRNSFRIPGVYDKDFPSYTSVMFDGKFSGTAYCIYKKYIISVRFRNKNNNENAVYHQKLS